MSDVNLHSENPRFDGVQQTATLGGGSSTHAVCNCTQDGLPYCGRPECDIDWCWYCGDEYTEPCDRHAEVGRP